MRMSIKLPAGRVSIKTWPMLRRSERDGKIPVLRLGPLYIAWWSLAAERLYGRQS